MFFFFFNDTATTEIYTLSLHDALPILADAEGPGQQLEVGVVQIDGDGPPGVAAQLRGLDQGQTSVVDQQHDHATADRKSTRLNSSHLVISYAVFCLKKKNTTTKLH